MTLSRCSVRQGRETPCCLAAKPIADQQLTFVIQVVTNCEVGVWRTLVSAELQLDDAIPAGMPVIAYRHLPYRSIISRRPPGSQCRLCWGLSLQGYRLSAGSWAYRRCSLAFRAPVPSGISELSLLLRLSPSRTQ